MILTRIEHLPSGSGFLAGLPAKGQQSRPALRRAWTRSLVRTFFPQSFLSVLLQTCLTLEGIPDKRGERLYTWLVRNVYGGSEKRLYEEWFKVRYNKEG